MSSDVKLSETALRIYLLLLREDKAMSAREVQRILGLSSSGLAYHHLEHLRMLGLVIKDTDGYRAIKKSGVIEGAIIVRSSVLPRASFYMGSATALTITYTILAILGMVKFDAVAVIAIALLQAFATVEFREQYVKLRRLLKAIEAQE
ncbi:helix-turn-helix domain-containing protein [Caldivirga sp.]|jgi:biotin operon repressor|uniref:helix-turn-helix domain-containing protein n=1 Tax=Caldivirga sp. TaxID=2080243 RepID=UPI003D0CB8FF